MIQDYQLAAHAFLLDFCEFAALNKNMGPGCDRKLHQNWDCCAYHRHLKVKLKALELRAKHLYLVDGLSVMCALWIAHVCKHFWLNPQDYNLPSNIKEDVISCYKDLMQ